MAERTLLVGVGNAILSDDAAGIEVARRIEGRAAATVREMNSCRLDLLDEMQGYDRAIVVDSVKTEGGKPGSWCRLEPAELPGHRRPARGRRRGRSP